MLQLYCLRSCSSQPSRSNTGFITWEAVFRHLNWTSLAKGAEIGGSCELWALGPSFNAFAETTNVCMCMKNKGWDLQVWHPLCCSLLSHCSLRKNHKLLRVPCWELSHKQLANPELLQVHPKQISRNACRLVLPLTHWNKPQDCTLFLLLPRTLQLHIFTAQVKVNFMSCTEMKKKTLHCLSLWTLGSISYMPLSFSDRLSVEIYLWRTGLIKILHPLLDCVEPFQIIHFMKHAWNQILNLQINKMVLTISFYIDYHLLKCWKELSPEWSLGVFK